MVAETTRKVNLRVNAVPTIEPRYRTRGSQNSAASGSVYNDQDGQDEESERASSEQRDTLDVIGYDGDGDYGQSKRSRRGTATKGGGAGRARARDVEEEGDFLVPTLDEGPVKEFVSKSGRRIVQKSTYIESSEGDGDEDNRLPTRARLKRGTGVVQSDDDGKVSLRRSARNRSTSKQSGSGSAASNFKTPSSVIELQNEARLSRIRKRQNAKEQDDSFEPGNDDDEDAEGEVDHDMELDADVQRTSPESEPEPQRTRAREKAVEPVERQGYTFRKRARVNYAIPPPLEEMPIPPAYKGKQRPKPRKGLGWSASGAELGRYMGLPPDDSDSDAPGRSPRKGYGVAGVGAAGTTGAGAGAGGGLFTSGPLPQDLSGGPSNFGKVTSAALADSDPLGVNQNINFDAVGGLDSHIASLKEMTLLPLLYPEVFQRFGVTPPRGVLFHGPPGTGKTLLARALASSCRSEGRSVAFFMRKGADCLSKWVGEAERQLRLLFEEARTSQPSIIFFDEIDGLAPVRSSKQDQIHASIVSTLLALMDGMDGRGQVIVIGATNRPDAIDPALRRPGRFDREFYFPLPSLSARESILKIHTQGWEGWEKDSDRGESMRKRLAKMTKGYGGADLRMLCTEAALNSVQRTYPQIYKSTERLIVAPEKIMVQPKDFMISIKKLVPSSARSTSSTASPLPSQLVPLLTPLLEHVKSVVTKIVPTNVKSRDPLEEAEWEWADDGNDNDGLEREMLLQTMETLRVYRPRLALCGAKGGGSGLSYVGSALLDWLEGFHVQSLDLGTLMNDSTRTVEAAIVQLFVEAKRHQPSVVYIPSLTGWCAAISETARSTVKAMLDTLSPTDPVLLLALVDGAFTALPKDVRQWFGIARSGSNRVDVTSFAPTADQRTQFFADLISNIKRKPSEFPDGWKKKKRILEVLLIAPPLAPKPPSQAELAAQLEGDNRTISVLKYRLGPVLNDLKRKFKVFTKKAHEEYGFNPESGEFEDIIANNVLPVELVIPEHQLNGVVDIVPDDAPLEYVTIEPPQEQQQAQIQLEPPEPPAPRIKMHNMDLEKMHTELYREKYLTLDDFMADIEKIVQNTHLAAEANRYEPERMYKAQALLAAAQVHYHDFDPMFRTECERMAVRERRRRQEAQLEYEKQQEAEREKQREKDGEYPPGTRRSNRTNGLAPEVPITDVGKLERVLKRQRSSEPSSAKDHASDDDSRSNKRSRMSEDALPELHPLNGEMSAIFSKNLVGDPTPASMPPITITEEMPSTQATAVAVSPPVEAIVPQSFAMSVSSLLNGVESSSLPPVSWSQNGPQIFTSGPHDLQVLTEPATAPHTAAIHPMPDLPLDSIAMGHQHLPPPDTNFLAPPATIPSSNVPESMMTDPDEDSNAVIEPLLSPRRPSTPPPDFTIDEALLKSLQTELVTATSPLDVEQLEQLRAAALDLIWRSRTEWDRTSLIHELLSLLREFVSDAIGEDEDEDEDERL